MISISKQINDLESEMIWIDKDIDLSSLPKNYITIYVSINWIVIKVLFNDSDLLESIHEKFNVLEHYENNITPIYCFHNDKRNMPYNGYIDRDKKIMEVYWMWFWIMKSELNGFVSSLSKWVPAHASFLSTNNVWWNLIVAWRNGWKSTATINLIHLCRNHADKVLLSDDWLMVENNSVTWVDSTLSIEPDNVRDNCHIDWINRYSWIDRKTSIKLDPNWFEWFSFWEAELNNVILLTQWMTRLITELQNLDEVARFMIRSAYHFPYNKDLEEKHMKEWINILKSRRILVYDRSHAFSKIAWFLELINTIRVK